MHCDVIAQQSNWDYVIAGLISLVSVAVGVFAAQALSDHNRNQRDRQVAIIDLHIKFRTGAFPTQGFDFVSSPTAADELARLIFLAGKRELMVPGLAISLSSYKIRSDNPILPGRLDPFWKNMTESLQLFSIEIIDSAMLAMANPYGAPLTSQIRRLRRFLPARKHRTKTD